MKNLMAFTFLVFIACDNPTPEELHEESRIIDSSAVVEIADTTATEQIHPYQDFLDFYPLFIESIQRASVGEDPINKYFHPTHGVYLITNHNGAMPTINRYMNLAEIENDEEAKRQLFNLCAEIEKQPKFEPLPKVICEDDVYDKMGCFAQVTNPLSESGIWNYSDLNDKEKQAVQFAAESVEITVINTFFFTFYFSKTEEGFKVTFIDIRTPCEA